MTNRFQRNLKRVLQEKNVSQAKLARRAGIPQQTINKLATGKYSKHNNPSFNLVCKLADALEVSLDDFRKE